MDGKAGEFESRAPHPRLRPFIDSYTGYKITGVAPGTHAGLPSRSLTFIVAFDDPLDVEHASANGSVRNEFWAMVAGLHTRPAVIRHEGRQAGVQIRVAPRGATALFGVPSAAMANEVVSLEQLDPGFSRELVDRLSSASTWSGRWAVLDELLLRALTESTPMAPELEAAWSLLLASHGTATIAEVATAVGWNRRTLSTRFGDTFGVTPKTMARIIRFERAERLLRLPTNPSLARVAHVCGYSDQSHMAREWVEFAGSSPTTWMSDETIPILQDGDAPPLSS